MPPTVAQGAGAAVSQRSADVDSQMERRRKACDELHEPRASLGAGPAATAPCGWYIHDMDRAEPPAHRRGRWGLGAQEFECRMLSAECRVTQICGPLRGGGTRKERVGGEPTRKLNCGSGGRSERTVRQSCNVRRPPAWDPDGSQGGWGEIPESGGRPPCRP